MPLTARAGRPGPTRRSKPSSPSRFGGQRNKEAIGHGIDERRASLNSLTSSPRDALNAFAGIVLNQSGKPATAGSAAAAVAPIPADTGMSQSFHRRSPFADISWGNGKIAGGAPYLDA